MVRRLKLFPLLWISLCSVLALPSSSLAQPSTASVSGTIYSGSGKPLANATVILNTPQQIIGGSVVAPTIFSTRTNSSGAITPITLVQNSVVQITINSGMVITGVVPAASSVNINSVLSGTLINTASAIQVNGTPLSSTATLNFQNGTGITVSNPSAGNIQFALSGSGIVSSVGASFTGGLVSIGGSPITSSGTLAFTVAGTSGGIPYFSSSSTWVSSGLLTANLPVLGGGAGASPIVGTRSGNTTQYVTTTGAQTSGNCVSIDASGNHVAFGLACDSGDGVDDLANGSVAFFADDFDISFSASPDVGRGRWTAAGITLINGEANHPGIIRQSTASAVSAFPSVTVPFAFADLWDFTTILRMGAATNRTHRIGLFESAELSTGDPANGIYFERLSTDTNWFAVSRASSVETRTNTGVAGSTGWLKLRMQRLAGPIIRFNVNGGANTDITTNIPTGSAYFNLEFIATSGTQTTDYDFVSWRIPVTR